MHPLPMEISRVSLGCDYSGLDWILACGVKQVFSLEQVKGRGSPDPIEGPHSVISDNRSVTTRLSLSLWLTQKALRLWVSLFCLGFEPRLCKWPFKKDCVVYFWGKGCHGVACWIKAEGYEQGKDSEKLTTVVCGFGWCVYAHVMQVCNQVSVRSRLESVMLGKGLHFTCEISQARCFVYTYVLK